ncbi:MAG TPA: DUF2911 domain-containing protein [Terriglobales bacterium]|jgi:hypothetical protein|nr:DUF2911 domain-containing protein [Terriglobales bacterium]
MKTVARVRVRLTSFRSLHLQDCCRLASFAILLGLVLVNLGMGQDAPADPESGNAFCTFGDGKQISARYNPVAAGRNEGPPAGKIWLPGGSAMTLFTDTEVTISNTFIPTGAYTMYLMPGKKTWTLIVSKNTKVDGKYDEKNDLARAIMETGTLGDAEEQLKIFFGHLGPKQCELNVDYGKTRAWVEFKEK